MIVSYLSVKLAIMCSMPVHAVSTVSIAHLVSVCVFVYRLFFVYATHCKQSIQIKRFPRCQIVCTFYFLSLCAPLSMSACVWVEQQFRCNWIYEWWWRIVLHQFENSVKLNQYSPNCVPAVVCTLPSSISNNFSVANNVRTLCTKGTNVRSHQFYHIFNK